jgi:diguanylate cyclase (GGDEF)-like protein
MMDGDPPDDEAPATIRAPRDETEKREDTVTEKLAAQPSAPVRDQATLTVLTGKVAGRVFRLESEKTVIGRGKDADIVVTDSGVSRLHARIIRWVGLAYVVQDLGSMNGTFVNGHRIERATISSGDRLQLGPSAQLRFALCDEAETALQSKLYDGLAREPLTELYTREHLLRQLRLEIAYARRHDANLSVVLVALHNQQLSARAKGDAAATNLLRRLASGVAECGRIEDLVARYDDGVLAVILRNSDADAALDYATLVRERTAALLPELSGEFSLHFAIGSTRDLSPSDGPEDLTRLLERRLNHCETHPRTPLCAHDPPR